MLMMRALGLAESVQCVGRAATRGQMAEWFKDNIGALRITYTIFLGGS